MDDDQEVKELVEKALVNGTDSANHSRAASRVSICNAIFHLSKLYLTSDIISFINNIF